MSFFKNLKKCSFQYRRVSEEKVSERLRMAEQNWELSKKDILQVADLTRKELTALIQDAIIMKQQTKAGIPL